MQSFVQYRRFRQHVEQQYERDKDKAVALGHHESLSPSSGSPDESPTRSQDIPETRDAEKGEA